MAVQSSNTDRWPQELKPGDVLYSIQNLDTGEYEYLIFSSVDSKAVFMRNNRSWWMIDSEAVDDWDDPKYSTEFVDVDFIEEYDRMEDDKSVDKIKMVMPADIDESALTAAAPGDCPKATYDIKVNLKNRERAIAAAGYGPLNPKEPNDSFWEEKANNWSVSTEEARASVCGNCVFFVITTEMRDCIASGLEQGGSSEQNAWDAIDQAELGYCEAFDFKCAASRTCDAWVVGGPITDETSISRGEE